ncbi:hypothetical protein Q7C36_007947 [Tachysurus vachellii]|uniref:Uncharacterized protein n=1 Tax=Tachysurus vachellii TaxID=175792 RepID=A0AA88N9M2_TACVA|nr:hypothetical protein Q7C36_007947 [Tachysurus vachellii]
MDSVFNVLQCSKAGGFGSERERMKAEHIALHPLLALRKSPHITQRNAACDSAEPAELAGGRSKFDDHIECFWELDRQSWWVLLMQKTV